jgi:hypothetical protein
VSASRCPSCNSFMAKTGCKRCQAVTATQSPDTEQSDLWLVALVLVGLYILSQGHP